MASAAVSADGKTIVITYSEAIKGSPTIEDYAISINDVSAIIKDAALSGNKVTLTLDARIPKENVTINSITYTKGEDASIKDNSNNLADTQTLSTSITNNSAVTDITKYTNNIANVLNGLTSDVVDATGMTGAQLVAVHGKLSSVDKIIGELIIKHNVATSAGSPSQAEALYQKFQGDPEDVWADASTYNKTGVEGLVNNTTIPKIVGIGSGSYANDSSAGHQTFSFAADKLHGRELLGLEEGGFNSKITVTGLESKLDADLSGIVKGTPNFTIEGAIATGSSGNTITLTGNLGKAFITITGDGALDVTCADVTDATFIMGTGATAGLTGATAVNLIDKNSDLDNAFTSLNDNSVLVDATDMDATKLQKVLANIDKVKTIIGNLHLVHALADASPSGTYDNNFNTLLNKYQGVNVTATATDMKPRELNTIVSNIAKIKEGGIGGFMIFARDADNSNIYVNTSSAQKLFGKFVAQDAINKVQVDASRYTNEGVKQLITEGVLACVQEVFNFGNITNNQAIELKAAQISGKTITGTGGKITITYMHEKLNADLSKIGINSGGNIEVIAQTTNAGDITFNGKLGVATFNILGTSQVTMEATAEFNNASFGIAAASTLILAPGQTGSSVDNKITGAGTLKITGTANADTIDLSGMDLSGFTGTTYITPGLDAGVADTITLKEGESKDIIEVNYNSSVKPSGITDAGSDNKFSAGDIITYSDGVDIITNFQAGASGDVLKVMNQYYKNATPSSALNKNHAGGLETSKIFHLLGNYASNAFTVADNGSDTLVLLGHSAEVESGHLGTSIEYNYSSIILMGVTPDQLHKDNFMNHDGTMSTWS